MAQVEWVTAFLLWIKRENTTQANIKNKMKLTIFQLSALLLMSVKFCEALRKERVTSLRDSLKDLSPEITKGKGVDHPFSPPADVMSGEESEEMEDIDYSLDPVEMEGPPSEAFLLSRREALDETEALLYLKNMMKTSPSHRMFKEALEAFHASREHVQQAWETAFRKAEDVLHAAEEADGGSADLTSAFRALDQTLHREYEEAEAVMKLTSLDLYDLPFIQGEDLQRNLGELVVEFNLEMDDALRTYLEHWRPETTTGIRLAKLYESVDVDPADFPTKAMLKAARDRVQVSWKGLEALLRQPFQATHMHRRNMLASVSATELLWEADQFAKAGRALIDAAEGAAKAIYEARQSGEYAWLVKGEAKRRLEEKEDRALEELSDIIASELWVTEDEIDSIPALPLYKEGLQEHLRAIIDFTRKEN